jgi:hypothetical protein
MNIKIIFYVVIFVIASFILYGLLNLKCFENFENLNSSFKICMFLTSKHNEEAENCIKTIENIGHKKNIYVTALDESANKYMNNLNVHVINEHVNVDDHANQGTKEFFKIVIQKPKAIYKLLTKYNEIILYTDTDIVFLRDIKPAIDAFEKSDYDIMFQDDNANYCSGFMLFKPNDKIKKYLKDIITSMERDFSKIDPNRKKGYADQLYFNKLHNKHNINVGVLNKLDFPNGTRYFDNNNTYEEYIPVIVHNNCIKGLQNKIDRFKKYGLWFI